MGAAIGGLAGGVVAGLLGAGTGPFDAAIIAAGRYGGRIAGSAIEDYILKTESAGSAGADRNAKSPPTSGSDSNEPEDTYCFVAGTTVSTKEGLKPIEQIKVGDLVLSREPTTGKTAYKPVTGLVRRHHREIFEVVVRSGTPGSATEAFRTMDDHPWRSAEGRWIKTVDLVAGTKLVQAEGPPDTVVSMHRTGETAPTFNIEVADFHTYFVGNEQVWAHDACDRQGKGSKEPPCSGPNSNCARGQPDVKYRTRGREPDPTQPGRHLCENCYNKAFGKK